MRVLVIPQAYPDEENPNITPFIRDNTIALQQSGHQVVVLHVKMLALRKWFSERVQKITVHEVNGITRLSVCMRYIRGFEKLNTSLFVWCVQRLFEKYIKTNERPDLIISHFSQYAGYAASYISKEKGIPFINVEHAGWLLGDKVSAFEINKLKQVAYSSFKFVCVSEVLKESVIKKVGNSNNMVVISNMIDDIFNYVKKERSQKFVFFSAGNLYEGKRFPLLVRAFCEAFSNSDSVELRIAGDGNQKEHIQKLILDNNRELQIMLLGSINKESMYREYVNCDAFVLPSEHETFGIVYREALAVGRPIITTNHQGFRDDWSNDFGIRINVDDLAQLVWALKTMVEHNEQYDGFAISEQCKLMYSKKNVMRKYLDIMNEIDTK